MPFLTLTREEGLGQNSWLDKSKIVGGTEIRSRCKRGHVSERSSISMIDLAAPRARKTKIQPALQPSRRFNQGSANFDLTVSMDICFCRPFPLRAELKE